MNTIDQFLDLSRELYNRKIVLVGNGWRETDEFEHDDLVVRMNRGQGDCQILWQSADLSPDSVECERPSLLWLILNNAGAHYLAWLKWASEMRVRVYEYDSRTYKGEHPRGPLYEWSSVLGKSLRTSPLSGIFALEFFSLLPVKEVYLTGYRFFWRDGKVPAFVYSHELKPQGEYLSNKIFYDRRIYGDALLMKLIRTGNWEEARKL